MLVRGVGGAEFLQPAGGLTRWLGVQVPGHVQSAEQPCLDPRVEADVVGSQPAGMVVGTGGVQLTVVRANRMFDASASDLSPPLRSRR